ncbi:CDA peptide synthetase I [Amycolatopsis camponoti]|uniref:CDA peptide synthetase I n=1 Tax=Amycolatopsis camponoti TaxID=2606593 RepID=A0A6I8LRA7_9PSEU|nr:non-ribosomal peptide synthetase [Amycolatopsis camponoti]VVJ20404.1 CDA peptide synthetase I [Amycolatopsis camponoti]
MVSRSLQERFAEQVDRTPDAVAVSADGVVLTYRQLDRLANRLAHRLLGLGAGDERPVAVLMDRSPDVVVAVLAVLKTGAAYLPLHHSNPVERQQWILEHAGDPILLTDRALRERGLPVAGRVVVVDEDDRAGLPESDPAVAGHPEDVAYVMYTSGTTGEPKGVSVPHRAVLGLVDDTRWATGWHDRLLLVAPHAFGVSTYELWVPLLRGGTIVLAPPGDLDIATLRRLITDRAITGLHLTAGLFRLVASEAPECFAGVREVLTGGDVIAPNAVRRVLETCPGTVVRAMYGATELSTFAVSWPMRTLADVEAGVPVGEPLDGLRAYVLDERLEPVADGAAGELYLAGTRLGRGYHGRPDLTADRFVADPFGGDGGRMYRTGDLVRYTAGGVLDFVGRAGDLVKIRGFRVELGEIETVVSKFAGLAHVAVVAREDEPGETKLAAYVVPAAGGTVDVPALRAHTAELLPDYMVPAFVVLDTLPLTPNGKLDRKALPVPETAVAGEYRAPVTDRQRVLCALFEEVLGAARVGLDDSFFDLDGQSMLAMQLISRIQAELGLEPTIGDLFNAPTVAALDELLPSGGEA